MKVELTPQKYNDLAKLIAGFGGDIETITESRLEEKGISPAMASQDMAKEGKIIEVDQSILNNIEEFIKLGNDAKTWYTDMNKKILSELGDSDGTLFLMLMAIFSANATLQTNFRNAARMYNGIKQDISNPKSRALLEKMLQEPKLYEILKSFQSMSLKNIMNTLMGKRQYLNLGVVKALQGVRGINSYLPNVTRTLKLYKDKGYAFSRQDVVNELSKRFNEKKATVGKDTIISAEKIFSFTLNLLDPSFKFESGWMPVTIDTWMVTFFFPFMSKAEKTSFISKKPHYTYLAKITAEQAARFNMQPHELQAALWVATLRKKKGEKYSSDFNAAIQKNLAKMKIAKDEIVKISGAFDKIIQVVGAV